MNRFRFALAVALLTGTVPTAAQISGSPSYEFLQAVRDDKGSDVDKILAKPGTRIIDTQDVSTGESALHIVVKRNDERYVTYLLAKGANPNLKDRMGNTPLLIAIDKGFSGLVPLLLKGKANPNLAGDGGQTPLIKAVLRRDPDMVRALLDAGADPDRKDYLAGKSARDYAVGDTRDTVMAKLFAGVTAKKPRTVSGPTL